MLAPWVQVCEELLLSLDLRQEGALTTIDLLASITLPSSAEMCSDASGADFLSGGSIALLCPGEGRRQG